MYYLVFKKFQEGLPSICYSCGRYGHSMELCPDKRPPAADPLPARAHGAREDTEFGAWMMVPPKRRPLDKSGRREQGQQFGNSGSRFEVLKQLSHPEGEAPSGHVSEGPQGGTAMSWKKHGQGGSELSWKKKGAAPKTPNKVDQPQKMKEKMKANEDSLFLSTSYKTLPTETTLDQAHHNAVIIADSRMPLRGNASGHQDLGPSPADQPPPHLMVHPNPLIHMGASSFRVGPPPVVALLGPATEPHTPPCEQ